LLVHYDTFEVVVVIFQTLIALSEIEQVSTHFKLDMHSSS